jgi:hypothetical protein
VSSTALTAKNAALIQRRTLVRVVSMTVDLSNEEAPMVRAA